MRISKEATIYSSFDVFDTLRPIFLQALSSPEDPYQFWLKWSMVK